MLSVSLYKELIVRREIKIFQFKTWEEHSGLWTKNGGFLFFYFCIYLELHVLKHTAVVSSMVLALNPNIPALKAEDM